MMNIEWVMVGMINHTTTKNLHKHVICINVFIQVLFIYKYINTRIVTATSKSKNALRLKVNFGFVVLFDHKL